MIRVCRVDSAKAPMELDLAVSKDVGVDGVPLGIYRIEGETLTFFTGAPRPLSLEDEADGYLVPKRR
ncbi:MAG: hypothetical protein P1V35_11225 [Planctomycetota bacterium]|nr:hypothetical protein [Planctomycetota bacterium]